VWSLLNGVSNALFGALLWPAQVLPEWLAGALLGVLAAPFALLVFRYTSNQGALERTRNRIQAHFLRHTLVYLARAALRALVLAGPFALALVQLESRFALRPLAPGEQAVVRVELDPGARASEQRSEIRVPRGLTLETPALRIDSLHEIAWRVRADLPGRYLVRVGVGDHVYERRVLVGGERSALARRVCTSGDAATLLAPSERALSDAGAVRCIEVEYPERSAALGLSAAAWCFLGGSLVLGFALRGIMGVHL
jgi:hypothetical protein